jgi:integrase/recombinase XerD
MVTLRQLLQHGLYEGHLRENPAANIRPLKERTEPRHRALSNDEVNALQRELSERHTRWMSFMIGSGLRKKEAEMLRWEDVDFDNTQITVRASTAKDAETRWVPLTLLSLGTLEALRAEGRLPRGVIFGSRDRREALRHAWKRTGLPGRIPSAHDFRHTFASRAIRLGLDLESLRRFLGHKTVITTQRYIEAYGDTLDRAADILRGIGGGFVTLAVTPAVTTVTAKSG